MKLRSEALIYFRKVAETYQKLGMKYKYTAAQSNLDHATTLRGLARNQ